VVIIVPVGIAPELRRGIRASVPAAVAKEPAKGR
jgi:hypothetical protein